MRTKNSKKEKSEISESGKKGSKSLAALDRCYDKIASLCIVPSFREKIWEIRTKWKIPKEQGFGTIGNVERREADIQAFFTWLKESNKEKDLNSDILNLCEDFNLTKERYRHCLKTLIVSGILSPPIFCEPKTQTIWNEKTKEWERWIKIYGDTTQEDVKKVWSEIERFQKNLPDYGSRHRGLSPQQVKRITQIIAKREKGETFKQIDAGNYTYPPKLLDRLEKSFLKSKSRKPSKEFLPLFRKPRFD